MLSVDMGMMFVSFVVLGNFVVYDDINYLFSWKILSLNGMEFEVIMPIDYISILFSSVIFFNSGVVFYNSESYMLSDMSTQRFYILVLLFVVSMLIVILSPNFFNILLSWDSLGLGLSALVHSSTLLMAGVYLMIRFYKVLVKN